MGKISVMNLEDLMISSMTMYILDNVSKRASFYKKSLDFKDYTISNLEKNCVKLNKKEYMYFDVIGDYFNKVSENYMEEYQDLDKTTIVLKLAGQLRNDFREFIKEYNSNMGNEKIGFGAFINN